MAGPMRRATVSPTPRSVSSETVAINLAHKGQRLRGRGDFGFRISDFGFPGGPGPFRGGYNSRTVSISRSGSLAGRPLPSLFEFSQERHVVITTQHPIMDVEEYEAHMLKAEQPANRAERRREKALQRKAAPRA